MTYPKPGIIVKSPHYVYDTAIYMAANITLMTVVVVPITALVVGARFR